MAAITSALIAIAGVVLGWIAIEIACKPCLEQGREAIDQSLNPDYDPDDEISINVRAPLDPNPAIDPDENVNKKGDVFSSASSTPLKSV